LGGGTISDVVEAAAQRLAVDGDADLSGRGKRNLMQGGVAAEGSFQRTGVKPVEDV
jgi:hypothetical protein